MAIHNFTLLLTLAFVMCASMSAVEGLKCLTCKDSKCKSPTSVECKSEDFVCAFQTIKVNNGTKIIRTCVQIAPQASLGCTTVIPQPGMSISNCFCDTDNCDPESGSRSRSDINAELGESAGLTLTPSIPAPLSIIICIIVAAIYKIQ